MIDIFGILSSRRCLKSGDFAAAQGMGNVGTVNNLKILKLNQHLFLFRKKKQKRNQKPSNKVKTSNYKFLETSLIQKNRK